MKKYEAPSMEIMKFSVEDIITASPLINNGTGGSAGEEKGDSTIFGVEADMSGLYEIK